MYTSTITIRNIGGTYFPPRTTFKLEPAENGRFNLVSQTPCLIGSVGINAERLHEWLTDGTLLAGG